MEDFDTNRRSFLEISGARALELIATAPLISILATNFSRKREYSKANYDKAVNSEKAEMLPEFFAESNKFTASLETLADSYNSAYYVAHTGVRVVPTKNGVSLQTYTYYRWEEPQNIPQHEKIFSWQEFQTKFNDRLKYIAEQPLIDEKKLDKISIETKTPARLQQAGLNVLIYGTEIIGLLGYEEAVAALCDEQDIMTWSERIKRMNTPAQISRRSVFKIGAAMAGATAAYLTGKYNTRKTEEGKEQLEKQIAGIAREAKIAPEDAFSRYFEIPSKTAIQNVQIITAESEAALNTGIEKKIVAQAFEQVKRTGQTYLEYLNKTIGQEIPESLHTALRYGHVTKELQKSANSQAEIADLGILLEGAIVGGTMAAILVPFEIINGAYK